MLVMLPEWHDSLETILSKRHVLLNIVMVNYYFKLCINIYYSCVIQFPKEAIVCKVYTIYNNKYTQREFKLKFSTHLKAYDIKYTESSKT